MMPNRVSGFLISVAVLPQTQLRLPSVLLDVAAFLDWITAIQCLRLRAADFNVSFIKIRYTFRRWMLSGSIFQEIHLILA